MNGWRARLGLIDPSTNTTNNPEFYRYLPDSVSLHTSPTWLEETTAGEFERMDDETDRCAELLGTAGVDVIAYGCTT